MRILDSNYDYYDFYQDIYPDDDVIFDRRNSYVLTKENFMSNFQVDRRFWVHGKASWDRDILLQIGNEFWLIKLTITATNENNVCTNYSLELMDNWYNYEVDAKLIDLSCIKFSYGVKQLKDKVDAINRNDFRVMFTFNHFISYKSYKHTFTREMRTIPILREIGFSNIIDGFSIYRAFETYFRNLITKNERTEPIGITDNDKIILHGFDSKAFCSNKKSH